MIRFLRPVFLLAICLPVFPQTYQSSFSNPTFDLAQGPKSNFGGVDVDVATGALRCNLLLGPGIGARGVVYQPGVRGSSAYVHQFVITYTDPVSNSPIRLPWATEDFRPGGWAASYTSFGDESTDMRPVSNYSPGTLDIALAPYPGMDPLHRFQVGELSGTAQVSTALPAGVDPVAILARFGYQRGASGPVMLYPGYSIDPDPVDPALHYRTLGSNGSLLLALGGTAFPRKTFQDDHYFGVSDMSGKVTFNYPAGYLVVVGDVAYEFSRPVTFREGSVAHRVSSTVLGQYMIGVSPKSHLRYVLTRILNTQGDEIRFDYQGRAVTLPDTASSPGQEHGTTPAGDMVIVSSIQANAYRNGTPTGTGIRLLRTATGITATYAGGTQAMSYTLDGSRAWANATDLDADPSSLGVLLVDWSDCGVSTFTASQDQTGDQVSVNFGAGRGGPVDAWVSRAAGKDPDRVVAVTWSEEYLFLEGVGTRAAPAGQAHYTVGVTRVDDKANVGGTWNTRTTCYDRAVPVPLYYTRSTETGTETVSTTGIQPCNPLQWQSTDFHCTVTHPDGSSVKYTYAPPRDPLPGDPLGYLCFIKNLPVKEEWFGTQGGDPWKVTTFDAFDLRTLGDVSTAPLSASNVVPYPVAWTVTDTLAGKVETHTLQGWDPVNFGWKTQGLIIRNPAGDLVANRSVTRTLASNPALFLWGRIAKEVPADTALPPVERTYDGQMDQLLLEVHGPEAGPRVELHQAWTGDGLLDRAWIQYPGQTTAVTGAIYGHDSRGFVTSIQPVAPDFAHLTSSRILDGLGQVQASSGPDRFATTYGWDGAGRLLTLSPPGGELAISVAYDRDGTGPLKATQTRGDQKTEQFYNGFGESILQIRYNEGGQASKKAVGRDASGRVLWESVWGAGGDAASWIQAQPIGTANLTQYDPYGRVSRSTSATGEVTTHAYPSSGIEEITRVAAGDVLSATTRIQRDPLGRITSVQDAVGNLTTYAWDSGDRITSVVQRDVANGLSQTRTWSWDILGRLTSLTQPESGTTAYSDIDASGKPWTTTYGKGTADERRVATTYDPLGRVTGLTGSKAGTVDVRQTSVYDGSDSTSYGKLVAASDGAFTRAQTYASGTGRLSSSVQTYGTQIFTQSFGYDSYGRRTQTSVGNHSSQVTAYNDALDAPRDLTVDGVRVATATFDPVTWALTRLDYGAGSGVASDFTYAADNVRLATLTHHNGAGTRAWTYGFDSLGRLTGDGEDTYQYDRLDRLVHAEIHRIGGALVTQDTAFDAFGNMKTRRTAGAVQNLVPDFDFPVGTDLAQRNQLPLTASNGGSTGRHYDGCGNLDQIFPRIGEPGNARSMTYDSLGRITSLQDTARGVTETYVYDPEGLRTVTETWQGSVLQARNYAFHNDLRQLVSEYAELLQGQTLPAQRTALAAGAKAMREDDSEIYASIVSPSGGLVVSAGVAVVFQGGPLPLNGSCSWNFGDGASASTQNSTHAYATPGTYTVTYTVRPRILSPGTVLVPATVVITVVSPPPTIPAFTASVTTIPAGGSTTLGWTTANASSATLNGAGTALSGSQTVYPVVTTTYTLAALGSGPTATASVTVYVVARPSINGFSASPASIYKGDASTLGWTVSGATRLVLDQGIGPVSGTSVTVRPSDTTTYTLTATNTLNGVDATTTATATVGVGPRPTLPSILSFTADPARVASGGSTILRWTVANDVGTPVVTLSDSAVAVSGTQVVSLYARTTYTLKAMNSLDPSKWVTGSVTVEVVGPPLVTFCGAPVDGGSGGTSFTILQGHGANLSWSVTGDPDLVTLTAGNGPPVSVGFIGSLTVTPSESTVYTLSATNLAGTRTTTVSVTPSVVAFSASPSTITKGRTATLNWSAPGATSLVLAVGNALGTSVLGSPSGVVAPIVTSEYTLTATVGGATTSVKVTVTVNSMAGMGWTKDLLYLGGHPVGEKDSRGIHLVQYDHLGSPRFISGAAGALESSQKFTPWGELLDGVGSGGPFGLGFTGHEQTDPSGLIYMQARFYLPMYGRFASPDPARDQHFEETQSWNIYSYVQNNPVMATDPTGMWTWKELGAGALNLATGTGQAAVNLAVHNPITQGFLQASDTIDATINSVAGRNAPMLSELGQAAERGASAAEMVGQALKGPTEVMAAAVAGNVAGKVIGALAPGAATEAGAAAQDAKASFSPNTLLSRQSASEMSGSQIKRLAKDMKANGFDASKPIEVAVVDGKRIILDGHHRVAAAIKAGIKEVPSIVRQVSDKEGTELLRQAAEARR